MKNLVNTNGMPSKYSRFCFCFSTGKANFFSFIYDNNLRQGEYTVASNYNSYSDIVAGDRFEIQIRFHRKIDGKKS
jgi:hypothetical protein